MASDIKHGKLSYYEFMIKDNQIRLVDAMGYILNYYMQNRLWDANEDYHAVRIGYISKLHCLMTRDVSVDDLIEVDYKGDERAVIYDKSEYDCCTSTIDPVKFIEFAHSNCFDVPAELLEFAGLKAKEKLDNNYVDKIACQAVAKTLWDEYPDMSIENIINHKAIQIYAGGKIKATSTLRRWISAVDSRPSNKKPGPDKK